MSVTLRNSGPRDVATQMFDGERSITAKFDQTFYGLTSAKGNFKAYSSRNRCGGGCHRLVCRRVS